MIIHNGVDLELGMPESPLVNAIMHYNGNIDIIQLLIDSGSDTTKALVFTCTIGNGNYDVCNLLVQSGAQLTTLSHSLLYYTSKTPLHYISRCCSRNAWRICNLFILADADIEAICDDKTPLMAAVIHGHISSVQCLLQHNANVNYQQSTGTTCLHIAARLGKLDVCQLLINFHADMEHIAYDRTPLMTAVIHGHISVVKYLLEHNADVNYKQISGTTCLHHAARLGKLDIYVNYYILMLAIWKQEIMMGLCMKSVEI